MVAAALRRLLDSPVLMTWASLIVRLSGVVIVLPVVLRRFVAPEVAVWQLFATIFSLVLMLDLGLSPSFSRLFAFARGGASIQDMSNMREREPTPNAALVPAQVDDTLRRLFGTLSWVYPRIAIAAVAVFACVGSWSLAEPIAACANSRELWVAWGVVLVGAGAAFLGNASAAALQGMDRVAAQRRVEVVTGAGQALCSVLAVSMGASLLVLVVVYQAWGVATVVLNRRLLSRIAPSVALTPASRDRDVIAVLWPAAWRSGVGVLASQGVIQMSGLVYSRLVSPSQLASYLLALRLVTVASQISQAPFYSQLPRLAELFAAGDRPALLARAQRGMRLSQWVLCAGLAAGAFALPPLLAAIGSRTPFVSPALWALLCLAFLVERFGAMHMQLYSLTHHIVWHIANGVTGVLMLAVAVLTYPTLHLAAFPVAMLVAYAVFYAPWAARLSSRQFGFQLPAFEARATLPAAGFLVLLLAARLAL
jgi:hypothetical protein